MTSTMPRTVRPTAIQEQITPALTSPSPVSAPPEEAISRLALGERARAMMAAITPMPYMQVNTSPAMPSTRTAMAVPPVLGCTPGG